METLHPSDFRKLDKYSMVLVSGPQRSGTNLVTTAIAEDTGLQYITEGAFRSTWAQRWWVLVQTLENVVIHCPGMCRWLHIFGPFEKVAVVFVRRPVEDIIASQERIGWQWEPYELMLYDRMANEGPIAAVKYAYWVQTQRERIWHAFEVEYESMRDHRLWVPKEQRVDFGPRQVRVGEVYA